MMPLGIEHVTLGATDIRYLRLRLFVVSHLIVSHHVMSYHTTLGKTLLLNREILHKVKKIKLKFHKWNGTV